MTTTLRSRNIIVDTHRTSMRLEPEMWEGLTDIARRERITINELCSRVNARRRQSSLTSAIRVYILAYYRQLAATTPGQAGAHGSNGADLSA
jgi:predicted DNA-binding ribbon-helix-helix protein